MDQTINVHQIREEQYWESFRRNAIPNQSEFGNIRIVNLNGNTITYFIYTQQIIFKMSFKIEEYLIASEYGIESEDCSQIYNFIMFMYTGKLCIQKENGPSLFYQYFLLAIKFKVIELVEQLMKIGQEKAHLLYRSAFLYAIVVAYQNPWLQEKQLQLGKIFNKFFSLIIKTNLKQLQEASHMKIQIIQNAFVKMKPDTLQQILKMVKSQCQNALSILQELFVNFKNAKQLFEQSYSEGELIFIQEAVNLYDEQSFKKFKNQLTQTSINFISQSLEKKQSFHFVQNIQCNSEQQYFEASCGHFICLRCFYDYFAFKSKLMSSDAEQNYYPQIRCLSRQTDPCLCDYVFTTIEFKQLTILQNHPIMKHYLK